MAINPHVNTTVGNEITKFCSKAGIDVGTKMLRCHHQPRRQVMGHHNNLLCRTFLDTLLDEVNTELMHPVVIICRQLMALIQILVEIVQAMGHHILIAWRNM